MLNCIRWCETSFHTLAEALCLCVLQLPDDRPSSTATALASRLDSPRAAPDNRQGPLPTASPQAVRKERCRARPRLSLLLLVRQWIRIHTSWPIFSRCRLARSIATQCLVDAGAGISLISSSSLFPECYSYAASTCDFRLHTGDDKCSEVHVHTSTHHALFSFAVVWQGL